jgi:hypothetical protein
MRSNVRRRPDGVIQITPRSARARVVVLAEAGALLGLFGACAAFLVMLAAELVRHPTSVALAGSCLVFGLTTARWVSTGQVLPARVGRAHGSEPERPTGPPVPPSDGPKGAA